MAGGLGQWQVLDVVTPPVAALSACEVERHALFCATREEDSLVVST